MLSPRYRFPLALSLVLLGLSPSGAAPVEKATPRQIAQWIEQLGDNKFSVRESASKKLWAAGADAEPALEEAAKSDDAEVARRARDILGKFQWGIYPDTPADIVALIQAYQSAEANTRLGFLQKLLQGGPAGLQAVLKITRNEKDPKRRRALGKLVSHNLPASLPRVLERDDLDKFEMLLEIGHESEVIEHNHYAAYWLLRGKLDARIAHFRSRLTKKPDEKRVAETLAYLYRAKGDLKEALAAAEKSENVALFEDILYEAADWKALAARKDFGGGRSDFEKRAYAAAFARLAGKPKEFDSALAEIRQAAIAQKPENESVLFAAAKAFLLNDRPAEGLELLAKTPNRQTEVFEILCTQLKYDEAMKLVDRPRPAESQEQKQLEVLKARTLYLLGDKDKAQELFARLAEQIKDGVDPFWANRDRREAKHVLLEAEYQIGLKDKAFEHAARALTALPPGGGKFPTQGSYVSKLFTKQAEAAEAWWELLRQRFKEETNTAVLKRLRDLMDGKLPAKEVKAWIEEAERGLSSPNARLVPALVTRQRRALAEAAALAGLGELARSLLEKNGPEALHRLGDMLAAKKQWAKAAECYRRAWRESATPNDDPLLRANQADPLPLFLAGDALVKAGQEKEGKQLIEQSHWVLLGDGRARFTFFRALLERGHSEAARRETELMMRVSEANGFAFGVAARRLTMAAVKRKEYLKAADGLEQSMLHCLNSNTYYIQSGAYVAVPAQIHQRRASGLLAAGKFDEAKKHIELSLTLLPGSVNLPIELVPILERGGHKKEAAALFERCQGVHEKMCRDYPRCAWAHNSIAWMSVCCRRNLDKALEHSQKATELAPNNAGYLDTLAEIHFQRGDKDKAVALQKRAIELDPKKSYFRKQLKRLEAGDPSTERPPENEDE